MKPDSPLDHQPKTGPAKCFYCGRFIGKNDEVEVQRIYGLFSPDSDRVFHRGCKRESNET